MNIIKVLSLPPCDLCGAPSRYDTPLRQGQWANVCRECAVLYTYIPIYELKNTDITLGSEYQLVEERSL